jgi:hypothetical protein
MAHTTGGRFTPVEGRYDLPLHEGFYEVIGKGNYAEILMNTSGSGESYKHDLINYISPSHYYDSGWYAWFYDCAPMAQWRSHLVRPKVLFTGESISIQHQWMHDYLTSIDSNTAK